MGRDQEQQGLAFSLYPLYFFLYSPFKKRGRRIGKGRGSEGAKIRV